MGLGPEGFLHYPEILRFSVKAVEGLDVYPGEFLKVAYDRCRGKSACCVLVQRSAKVLVRGLVKVVPALA